MKLLFVLALVFSLSVNASVLEKLKDTPASRYDVGKMQLELMAFLATQKLEGEKVKGTKFEFKKFSVVEESKTLGFKISMEGRAKYITQDQCQMLHKGTQNIFNLNEMVKELWPGLDSTQYESLSNEVLLVTELISEENSSLSVECRT